MALAGFWLAGAGVVLCWWLDQKAGNVESGWRLSVLLAVLTLTAVGLRLFWRNQWTGKLVFDGDHWWLLLAEKRGFFPRTGEPARIAVILDAQRAMLLRLPATGVPAAWLWVEKACDPVRWHALRCALYSPANRPTGSAGEPNTN